MTTTKEAQGQTSWDTARQAQMQKIANAAGERIGLTSIQMLEVVDYALGMENATWAEKYAVLAVVKEYGLNPLTREIYAFYSKKSGKWNVIVGIDGWYRIANNHPDYDGFTLESAWTEEGELWSCTATLYHKKRKHPIVMTEYLKECIRDTPMWNGMPHRMLQHRAFAQATRAAFGVSGIYHDVEPGEEVQDADAVVRPTARVEARGVTLTDEQRAEMQEYRTRPRTERVVDTELEAAPADAGLSSPAKAGRDLLSSDAASTPSDEPVSEPDDGLDEWDREDLAKQATKQSDESDEEGGTPADVAAVEMVSDSSNAAEDEANLAVPADASAAPLSTELSADERQAAVVAFIGAALEKIAKSDGSKQAISTAITAERGRMGSCKAEGFAIAWDARLSKLELCITRDERSFNVAGGSVIETILSAVERACGMIFN